LIVVCHRSGVLQAKSVKPGSIFVLDNAKTHHCNVFLQAITDIGCAYVFLPAYSPDFNAIGASAVLFDVVCIIING
jgi:transposase